MSSSKCNHITQSGIILNSSYSEFAAVSCTSVYSFILKGYKFVHFVQETAENAPNSE